MKKLIIAVIFTLSAVFASMTAWAATIGSGALNDFSSGSTLSSTDMNTNFTIIKDAVNANSSLRVTLPDGVSTYLRFYLAAPADYVAGTTSVMPYWSGCEGTDVRLGLSSQGYVTGDNIISFTSPVMLTKSISNAAVNNFRIAQSLHLISGDISSNAFITFSVGRAGADVLDTCAGNLYLWGVKLLYPTSGTPGELFIPAHALSR